MWISLWKLFLTGALASVSYLAEAPSPKLPIWIWQKAEEVKASTQNKVFLTIDDGPTPYTQEIVDSLESLWLKATFFCVGQNITEKLAPALQDAQRKGHSFWNHSYSHANFRKLSLEKAKEEVIKTDQKYQAYGIQKVPYFRFPYGSKHREKETFSSFLKEQGHKEVFWNIDTRDWDKKTTKADLIHSFKDIKPGDIILIHDRSYTAKKTLVLIDSLLEAKQLVSETLDKKTDW